MSYQVSKSIFAPMSNITNLDFSIRFGSFEGAPVVELADLTGREMVEKALRAYNEYVASPCGEDPIPDDMVSLRKFFCANEDTIIYHDIWPILKKGQERYEKMADKWVPPMKRYITTDYSVIYLCSGEARFCAVPKVALWKVYEEFLDNISFHELVRFIKNIHRDDLWNAVCLLPVDRSVIHEQAFRQEHGLKIKTGKILSLLFNFRNDDPAENKKVIEVLAGYVTDAMRYEGATIDDVQVCDEPSCIYTLRSYDFGSCMRDQDEEKFYIYDAIPDCSIAYITDPDDDDYLLARALLWDNVEGFAPTTKIMDTIYADSNESTEALKKWATANGYWYKVSQSNSERKFTNGIETHTIPSTAHVHLPFSISRGMYDQVPYIDTFGNYNPGGNILTVGGGRESMKSTEGDGGYITDVRYCDKCGDLIETEEIFEYDGKEYCEYCKENNFYECENCHKYVGPDDIQYNEDDDVQLCDECWSEQYFYCHHCEKDHRVDDKKVMIVASEFDQVFLRKERLCEDALDEEYPDHQTCPYCNNETNKLIEIDGEKMCVLCINHYTFKCDSCGELHLRASKRLVDCHNNLVAVCKECYENQTGDLYRCDECASREPKFNELEYLTGWCDRKRVPAVLLGYEQLCETHFKRRLTLSRIEEQTNRDIDE